MRVFKIPNKKPINIDIDIETENMLTHNKECAKSRQKLAESTDDVGKGFLLATFCICHGAEDIVATNFNVVVKRVYRTKFFDVETEQRFTLYNPTGEELDYVRESVMDNVKLEGNVSEERITAVTSTGFDGEWA